MLLRLAWRNIWRNKRRSLIVLTSIVVGLVAIILYDAVSAGFIRQMLENQIGAHYAHIQIHKRGYHDNPQLTEVIPHPEKVEAVLEQEPGIRHYSRRVISNGILSSATNSYGIVLVGVEPEREQFITIIKKSIVAGRYLSGAKHEVVLGRQLAERLGVTVGDKVVAMAATTSGRIGSDLFRVVGIFQSPSSEFDKVYVFVSLENAREMLELGQSVTEYALIVEKLEQVRAVKDRLSARLAAITDDPQTYEVLTFHDLLPLLVMQMEMYREAIFVFYAIIALAMIFGIVNTMLMSVFERIQEFGVLMAIGMKNSRLFNLILLEALFLGSLGTVAGFVLGYLVYLPLSHTGINLGYFSEGLNAFGTGTIIYPDLTLESIISALVIVPLVSVLGAIYPALRAIRLEPVTAIRYV